MLNKHCAYPDRYTLLKEFARENRKHMTEAEECLWKHIKGEALGYKFLRQYIIGDYIVDFISREQGLIIEVDGAYHFERTQQEDDRIRQNWLESQGYHIIRFTNEEVLNEIDYVKETIRTYFK